MERKQIIPIVIAVAVVVVGGGIVLAASPTVRQQVLSELQLVAPETGGISASGFIEAEEIVIAAEVGGRIVELLVEPGDVVEPGQELVRLDETLIRAQVELARAGLEVAEATLAQLQAGARPEQIRQAEAALAQAEAARDGAYQGWQDLLALQANPQELNAQIALAEAQLAEAEAAVRQAAALRDAAEIGQQGFDRAMAEFPPGQVQQVQVFSGSVTDIASALPAELVEFIAGVTDGTYTYGEWQVAISSGTVTVHRMVTVVYPLDFHLVPTAYWRAWVGFNTAAATQEGARQALSLLYEMRSDPQQLQAQIDAAEAQYRAAEGAVEMARAVLEGLRDGATAEELAAAAAQVQQAQAELDSVLVLLGKLTLTAPAGGHVLEVIGHAGELAAPGAPLITVADLDQVTLTVYVPETQLGAVRVGQEVEVRVDSFPDRIFTGRVATIASEAEFTPRNVQTQEERVNMVFAVRVSISNPDHALGPGMPADAVILTR